jgi:hypothetical protein
MHGIWVQTPKRFEHSPRDYGTRHMTVMLADAARNDDIECQAVARDNADNKPAQRR